MASPDCFRRISNDAHNRGHGACGSPKQATDGKDISSIIGKKGAKADPSNWDIRYVEKSRYTTDPAGRKALFDIGYAEGNSFTCSHIFIIKGSACRDGHKITYF